MLANLCTRMYACIQTSQMTSRDRKITHRHNHFWAHCEHGCMQIWSTGESMRIYRSAWRWSISTTARSCTATLSRRISSCATNHGRYDELSSCCFPSNLEARTSCTDPIGLARSCMALHGLTWPWTVLHGLARSYMALHSNLCGPI